MLIWFCMGLLSGTSGVVSSALAVRLLVHCLSALRLDDCLEKKAIRVAMGDGDPARPCCPLRTGVDRLAAWVIDHQRRVAALFVRFPLSRERIRLWPHGLRRDRSR